MEHTFMMVLDHVGHQEAMVYLRAAWSAASCAHHCDVTGTETRDSLLFERAAWVLILLMRQ